MSMESVMLESASYRERFTGRVDVLDRVGALVLLPDGVYATSRMVADYFGIEAGALRAVVLDHRRELEDSGYRVLEGEPLSYFKQLSGIQGRFRSLALFSRRTMLNVAMLLRDSEVAREVRRYLLDAEERSSDPLAERVARCEGMLLADRAVITAMSVRLCRVSEDVRVLGVDVQHLREDVRGLREDVAEIRRGLGRLGLPRRGERGRARGR